jgi:hypothetical protein
MPASAMFWDTFQVVHWGNSDLEENIGGIEVPMADAFAVHVAHASGDVLEDIEDRRPAMPQLG